MQCMHIVLFRRKINFVFIGTDVSTRYTRRGESTYQRFARYIAVMAEQKKGNYMALFSIVPIFWKRYIRAFWSVLITKSTVSVRFRIWMEESEGRVFGGI